MQDIVFISHANASKDNGFTKWLALQLAKEGYPVWCDETELLGGEYFWPDIEEAIHNSAKFLYVLSNESNTSVPTNGEVKELDLAERIVRDEEVNDFIIPLQIEDLDSDPVITLSGINTIYFHERGWADGLARLLKKLERDQVPKDPQFNPETVTSWWRERHSAALGVSDEKATYLSDWFPIRKLPQKIHYHSLPEEECDHIATEALPYPAFINRNNLISFAELDDLFSSRQLNFSQEDRTSTFEIGHYLTGVSRYNITEAFAHHTIYQLFRQSWERELDTRPLKTYTLSGDRRCDYFPLGFAEGEKVWYQGVDGRTYRQLAGKHKKSHWHFGLSNKVLLDPMPAFLLKTHVLFSDDGTNIWDSKNRLHKARRSKCKNWWNPEWRDRLLASMSWIAEGEEYLSLPLGSDTSLEIRTWPVEFEAPKSYELLK